MKSNAAKEKELGVDKNLVSGKENACAVRYEGGKGSEREDMADRTMEAEECNVREFTCWEGG